MLRSPNGTRPSEQITTTSQADEHHRMTDLPGFPKPSTALRPMQPFGPYCGILGPYIIRILLFRVLYSGSPGLDQGLHEVVKADRFGGRPGAGPPGKPSQLLIRTCCYCHYYYYYYY